MSDRRTPSSYLTTWTPSKWESGHLAGATLDTVSGPAPTNRHALLWAGTGNPPPLHPAYDTRVPLVMQTAGTMRGDPAHKQRMLLQLPMYYALPHGPCHQPHAKIL